VPYILPTFNLTCNIWRAGHIPGTDPPDVTADCNLAWGRRVNTGDINITAVGGFLPPAMILLLPKLTDIRGYTSSGGPDLVEVPAGSQRIYQVGFVDDLGKGFANEHRGAAIFQSGTWPDPIP